MKFSYTAFALALSSAASVAAADDAALIFEARKCTEIEAPGIRMICYDRVLKDGGKAVLPDVKAPPATPPDVVTSPPTDAQPTGNWRTRRDKSAMTDQETVVLSLQSNEMVQCRQFGSPSYLTLIIRCMEDTTSLYITGDCHVASGFYGYGKVTLRLDDGKPFNRNMDDSTDSSALGLWDGGSSIPLLKQMIGKDRMIARFTPFGANPIEPSFTISGLDEAIKPVREACGW